MYATSALTEVFLTFLPVSTFARRAARHHRRSATAFARVVQEVDCGELGWD
jgi:hypothetical protein